MQRHGEVAEWSKAHAWKVCIGETLSWVRIPLSPPLAPEKLFSRRGPCRILPLFSRVMREGLLTGPRPEGHTCILSRPIFSGPVNRLRSGEQPQAFAFNRSFEFRDARDLVKSSGWRMEQRSNAVRGAAVRLQLATNLAPAAVRALC